MKQSILILLSFFSIFSANASSELSFVCFAEISGGQEQLYVKTFRSQEMAVYLESFSTPLTPKSAYVSQGDMSEYGYANLRMFLADGSMVVLEKDYDEYILDISNLKNVGLTDSRYICYPLI